MKSVIEKTIAALMLVCASSAWATYENGTALSWKSRDSITTKTNLDGGGYSFKIKLPVSDDLPKFSRVKITQIKIGARQNKVVTDCGAYIRINGVNSDSISAFDGAMPVDSSGSASLNVCNYVFSSDLILMAGIEYTMQPYNSSGTAINAATAAIKPLPSPQVIYFGSDTSWCCAYEVYGEVISTVVPTYKASPSGTNVSLNSLSWTLDDEAADLPSDLSTCGLEVTLNDGATLAIDKDISAIITFALKGENATLDLADSSYMSATTAWDFSGFTGNLTFNVDDDIDATISACLKPWMNSDLIGLTVKVSGDDSVAASWSGNTTFTTHTTFDGGTANLTVIQDSNGIDLCNNSSNVNPLWRVKDNTILNLTGKDLGGWSAAQKAQYCVMAVDGGGRLNLKDNGSNTFFYQGRFLLAPDATLDVQTTNNRLKLNGGITSGYEQIYVPDQITDMTATPAVVSGTGAVNANNNGFGIYVGSNAKLDWSAPINRNAGNILKSGAGTLTLKNMCFQNYFTGSEGTIELLSSGAPGTEGSHYHTACGIPFSGTIKVVTEDDTHQMFLWSDSANEGMFANRPALDASGEIRLYNKVNTYPVQVRNLCGTGVIRMGGGASGGYRYIDTQQTSDTTFDGAFITVSGYESYDSALKVSGDTELHSLTLTANNTTKGPLDIDSNAKVVFSSTGKWSGGTVTVKDGGVLESQNSAAIAANLKVEEGATLKFASGVQLSATDYDWSAISNDESINVDLSAITPSATPVTLIADGVDVSSDKFRVAASQCPVTLSVVNGALKASFFNFWRDGTWGVEVVPGDDATLYISQNSELTVSEALSLGAVTVVKEGEGNVALTISGASALTTGGWTIPEGVTVNTPPTMTISGKVSGAGVLNVPANNTLAMDDSDCSVKITANAGSTLNFTDCAINGGLSAQKDGSVTINTYGTVSFGSSANNDFQYSTTLNVESGTTTYNSKDDTKLWCTINVKSGATLVNAREDGFNWGADTRWPIHAHIWGTLTMNEKWTIGAGNYIHLYDGALIDGTASNALHFNTGCGNIVAEKGDSIITAPFVKGWGTIAVETKAGATLSTVYTPEIATRTGEGKLLKRVQNARWGGGVPPTNYDGVERYSSTSGTTANGNTETFLNSAFTGIFKVTTENGGYVILGWVANGSFNNPIFAGRPTLWANGDIRIFHATSDRPFTINNLSGTGYLKNGNTAGNDSNVNKYIDTLQTEDTTYNGVFPASEKAVGDPALTVRGDSELHSLTLTGASTTTGPLIIENNAKVVFSSTGKWSGGTVTVKNGGVLESQNSDDVAATLVVEKGATLKFANGVALAATAYDWTNVTEADSLTDDEKIKIDLSNVIPASEVTLIAAVGNENLTADMFTIASSMYSTYVTPTLVIDNGALKVRYSGNLCVDGTWLVGPTANQAATIALTQDSTLTVSSDLSLGAVTIMKATDDNVAFTITGAGALAVTSLTIPAGVTVYTPASFAASSVSGQGTINIPVDTIATISGICTARVVVNGTLKSSGTAIFSNSNNYIVSGGLLDVVSGTTTFSAPFTNNSDGTGICGNITVEYGSTFTLAGGAYNSIYARGNSILDISGTFNMGSRQWQLGTGITINLRNGAVINGNGDSTYGDWGFVDGANTVHVFGDAEIAASIKHNTTTVDIAEGATLTISGTIVGSAAMIKSGAGTLDVTANTLANPLTINAGAVIGAAVPTSNVTINENGTFTLQNASWTGTADKFSGNGTLELLANSSDFSQYAAASTFSGKLKVVGNSSKIPYFNGTAPQYTNKPEFELSGYMTLTDQFAGEDKKFTVKNLVGAAGSRIDPYFNANAKSPRYVSTLQTRDTEFAGTFISENNATDRKTALYVYGQNETVHSLTLSGINTSYGPLKVDTYGKVVFTSGGSWLNGEVTVGANGYLESTNATAITKLALADGANIVFPTSSSTLTGITGLTFASGTTYVSFADGVPDSGTLIDWTSVGSAPDGDFELAGDVAGTHILTKGSTGLSIAKIIGSVTKTLFGETTTTTYTNIDDLITAINMALAEEAFGGTLHYVTIITDGDVVLPKYADMMVIKNEGGATITISGYSDEYTPISTTVDGTTTYTFENVAREYIWKGGATKYVMSGGVGSYVSDPDWTNPDNWNFVNSSSETVSATRYPTAIDTVVFNDGASVTHSAVVTVEGIAVNGAVSVGGTSSLETSGAITGSGTLTIASGGLASVASGITVVPNVVFGDGTYIGCGTGGDAITFNGDVSLPVGTLSLWNAAHSFAGTTILSGNFTKAGGNFALTLGDVVVSASTTPTISAGTIAINGAVTVADNAIFTIPASRMTIGESATFSLNGADARLVDNGSGASGKVLTTVANSIVMSSVADGVTTYTVAGRTTTTVGEDAVVVITPATGVTSITVSEGDSKVAIPGTVTQVSGVTAANLLLKVNYTPQDSEEQTAYYSGILSLDGSGNVSLNPAGAVGGVDVKPAVDTSVSAPMSIDSTSETAKFTVKSISGLYYAVTAGTSIDEDGNPSGTVTHGDAVQATGTTTSPIAPEFTGTVMYYKVAVGRTAAEAAQ